MYDDCKVIDGKFTSNITEPVKDTDNLSKNKLLIDDYLEKLLIAIDEHHILHETVKDSEQKYRTLFEKIALPIIVADVNTGIIIDINDNACKLMGYERQKLVGLKHHLLHSEGEKYKIVVDFEKNISSTCGVKRHFVQHAYGYHIPVEITANNFFEVGESKLVIGIFKDFTDGVLQGNQSKINKEKGKKDMIMKFFIDNLSHELRTPMNAIMGFTDIVLGTELDDDQVEYLNFVRDASGDLLGVIEKILNFSEIQSGGLKNTMSPFSVVDLIRKLILAFKDKIIEKDLACSCNYVNEFPLAVIADSGKIELILNTFISNAIKFTKIGSVNIGFYITNEKQIKEARTFVPVRIVVEDTGIGIPEDKLATIFDNFSQVDSSSTRAYGGMGLGLAIAKGYSEIINANISVESVLGKGSRFILEMLLEVCDDNIFQDETFDSLSDLLMVSVIDNDNKNNSGR